MKEDKQKNSHLIFVPSYSNAFKFHILGRSAGMLIFDSVSLFFLTWALVYAIGQLPYFYDLYRWTWNTGWWFIPYIVIPITVTILIVVQKRDGLSVWRWVYTRILFAVNPDRYTPFTEPMTAWKRFWNWIRREEEIY